MVWRSLAHEIYGLKDSNDICEHSLSFASEQSRVTQCIASKIVSVNIVHPGHVSQYLVCAHTKLPSISEGIIVFVL